jgi:hypothetical protein
LRAYSWRGTLPKRLLAQLNSGREEANIQRTRERTALTARGVFVCFALVLWLSGPLLVRAQEPAGAPTDKSSLPDSPEPKAQKDSSNPALETTTRFVGYMTNSSFVFPDIATSEGPMAPSEKFRLFVNQSISPPFVILPLFTSAYNQARNVPKEYGQGWNAYGNRYGESIARASSNSFFDTFLLASVLKQDPRFFPQNRPSLWGSIKYSAQRLVVTRTNSGRDTFNTSGILGTFMSESLANAYLPPSQQTAGKTFERVGTDLIWKFAGNMFKNYWPELFHTMKLNRLGVTPAKTPDDQSN